MRAFLAFALITIAVLDSAAAQRPQSLPAPYVVIVHRGNPTTTVSRAFLADALMKRVSRWPHGETIRPVDLSIDSSIRRRVTDEILHRTVQAIRSYWQQMIFSGRGVPPVEFASERDVVRYVATHPGAVGYVSGTADVSAVRVVSVR